MGLKGAAREALKGFLRELEDDGAIERGSGRRFAPAGRLPDVTVLEIIEADADGDLHARPTQWKREDAPPRITLAPPRGRERLAGPALGIGDRVLARLSQNEDGSYDATVMKRLGQSAHHVLGVMVRARGELRVRPVDRKSKLELAIGKGDDLGAKANDLVLVAPMAGRLHGLPRGKVIENLGTFERPGAISLIAIHAHGLPDQFPPEVVADAEKAKPIRAKGREDLRPIPLITIDPVDARDHDDAVWAAPDDDKNNEGGAIVIVAIADVAGYVTPGSPLDREALKRGNSTYFPDRVVPMLPEHLSNELCSLKEAVDRPCLAVRMVFDKSGAKKRHSFTRGIMRSAAKLSYQQVQQAIDGHPDEKTQPLLEPILKPLWAAYAILKRARDARGPLDLDLPEHRVHLDDAGNVRAIEPRQSLDSMKLIEEFMIQANVAAAEELEKHRTPLIYRVHAEPTREKLSAFAEVMKSIGLSFTLGQVIKPDTFNRLIARAAGTPHIHMINEVTLRTQAQAEYAPENGGHFGLNLRRYAHFTSPIRRYADLIVHRALIRALKMGDDGLTDREIAGLASIAEQISLTERRSMAAERDSIARYLAAYLQDRLGAELTGRITGVTRFGLFVRLDETGADGMVPIRALGREFFRHDERLHALIGDETGTRHRLGDPVRVIVREAAPVTGGLRLELLENLNAEKSERPTGKRRGQRPPHSKRKRRR